MSDDVKNLAKDVQDRIRNLAYLMWESAGKQQNMASQYWLNAEREILASMQAATQVMLPARTQRQKTAQNPAQPATPSPVDSIEARQAEAAAAQASAEDPAEPKPESRQPSDTVDAVPAEAAASAASETAERKPATVKAGGRRKPTK
ncbi:MAG: DUF2934 domain-containing protein [Hyphomicrobium sp.]